MIRKYESFCDASVEWIDQIPAHWQIKPLKYVVDYNPEKLPETTDPDYMLQYVDIGSVDRYKGVTNIEKLPYEKAPSRAQRIVCDGDTIVSTVRTYLRAVTGIITIMACGATPDDERH